MPIYEKADASVAKVVKAMVSRYHKPLADHNVRIDLLFAYAKTDDNGDPIGVALKHQGYQALAVARVVSYKDRVAGRGDCEIVIDGDNWQTTSDASREALIDHELEHFQVCFDKNGVLKTDDLDRPKIKLCKHDHQFGWFDAIVRRHGNAAFEAQQAQAFVNEVYTQQWLPFMDESEGAAA